MSFHIFSIHMFESPILSGRPGGVPIYMGGVLWRRQRIIDDFPAAIVDQLDLDSVGPDELI